MDNDLKYDIHSADSIVEFSKKLKNKTLRQVCGAAIEKHGYKGKGNFGQILEKFYFGYEPNSDAAPDFLEAGLELKSSPLKVLKNGEFRSKERLVLNIINYLEVHKEEFDSSSFLQKNAHLLLVFYLHEKETDLLDYLIKLVDGWKYPEEDLKIIKRDWEFINKKIKEGRAHELSEGDTFYLGACTKGSTALKSYRKQPFNEEKAKQRAYSLKQGYVNHIIAKIAQNEKHVFGKLLDKRDQQIGDNESKIKPLYLEREDLPSIASDFLEPYGKVLNNSEDISDELSIEEVVVSKFEPFYGCTSIEIENDLSLDLNRKAKSYFANLSKAILGIKLGQKIEEFEKADIQVKTVRLKENLLPKEDISFPTFKYEELILGDWEDAEFKSVLESKFFFIFYQYSGEELVLRKATFWNMPYSDILEAKTVWDRMRLLISTGKIVKEVTSKGIRKTHFPKKSEFRISHVRPHAQNKEDVYPLPVKDVLTGLTEFTKHCFWLNASYVRDNIFKQHYY
ncbi:Sau3AI family type II restriction endonuclease [Brumimicrobium oceani]|uniref:DNA mismatch repair protein n=1 Tax=Brumimicrobium oceani TaxID=2100725 RepID=A0A2U2XE22_9FLAO|nr:Sau3AI family type II restriction endonuclease [Brumimicrobium oceani]PWH86035.1 DNA mismatch repair protein [Brumimicrobium oceani]